MGDIDQIKLKIPTWVARTYTVAAILLVPWTIYLALKLPSRHLSQHWDLAWVGLDVSIMFSFLLTGFLASLKSKWVIMALPINGTLLTVDAWFDVVSARHGTQLTEALLLALLAEIPLAVASFYFAYKSLKQNI